MSNEKKHLRPLPTQERLREVLIIDAKGSLIWRERVYVDRHVRTFNSRFAGKPAGSLHPDGRLNVTVDWKIYTAARAAWVYHFGTEPLTRVSFLDGDNTNLSAANLAAVQDTDAEKKGKPPGRSGHRGIRQWNKRWHAFVSNGGKRITLGSFATIGEAVAARAAALQSGYEA